MVQKSIKERFEKAQHDEIPLILNSPVKTEKSDVQSPGLPECEGTKREPTEKLCVTFKSKNDYCNNHSKYLLADRPKAPEKFFGLPNMANQVLADVINSHRIFERDNLFFYVDPNKFKPKNASAVLHNFFFKVVKL